MQRNAFTKCSIVVKVPSPLSIKESCSNLHVLMNIVTSCLPLLMYDRIIIHVNVFKHTVQHEINISSVVRHIFSTVFDTRELPVTRLLTPNKSLKPLHMAYIKYINTDERNLTVVYFTHKSIQQKSMSVTHTFKFRESLSHVYHNRQNLDILIEMSPPPSM